MSTIEWGVQYKTFRDGDYDRGIYSHWFQHRPLTEEEARAEVDNMTAARIPARLVTRTVSEWGPAA